MFPLTLDGITRAVDRLVKSTPSPVPALSELYPDLREFEAMDDFSL